jgi:hypothetical protein
MPDIYYHGTFMKSATEALLAGEPLRALRPEGTSFVQQARQGHVYLSPSFNVAAEYAFSKGRSDWPNEFDAPYADMPHVFEFHHVADGAEPDEDELGFAYKAALCIRAGLRHEWSMNSEFASALTCSPNTIERLASNAERSLVNTDMESFIKAPHKFHGVKKTALGHQMRPFTDYELRQELIDLGISVATTMELKAAAAYKLSSRVMKVEDAEEIWRHVPSYNAESIKP